MRWFWIDRFLEFQAGRRAVAVKNITLVEEAVDGYLPGHPVLPASLIVEGLAQTGGLLVAQQSDFRQRVVLAKVSSATFHRHAQPGETLRYTATLQSVQQAGALVRGTSHVGEQLQAEIELFFAQLDDRFEGVELFDPAGLLRMLRLLRLFDVGVNPDGSPLKIPQYMLQAEQQRLEQPS